MPHEPRRAVIVYAVATLSLGLITLADAVARAELSFIVFYFIPVSVAAWGGSRSGGVVFAVLSTFCWWISDRYNPVVRPGAFYLYWETATHLVAYLIMALGVAQLRDAVQRQRDLLRIVSHDLRSPLSALIGHAHLLARRAELDPWCSARVQAILRVGHRMDGMIDELVDAARGRHRERQDRQPVTLGPFLHELLGRMSATLPRERVDLVLEREPPLAVSADPALLERIVVNLVSNALKYSPETERVTVRAVPAGSRVVLSVEDRGPGIAPEDRAHLFERYYRGRASTGTEGLGLGLHGTRILVRSLRGRIRVEEAPSGGAAFRVELPRAEVPRPAAARGTG